ncbi:hypothetical protein N7522_013562 [Penicillium canescens]|nr:hypothetical protein N7522_013562 [Penicillium canescens]
MGTQIVAIAAPGWIVDQMPKVYVNNHALANEEDYYSEPPCMRKHVSQIHGMVLDPAPVPTDWVDVTLY